MKTLWLLTLAVTLAVAQDSNTIMYGKLGTIKHTDSVLCTRYHSSGTHYEYVQPVARRVITPMAELVKLWREYEDSCAVDTVRTYFTGFGGYTYSTGIRLGSEPTLRGFIRFIERRVRR